MFLLRPAAILVALFLLPLEVLSQDAKQEPAEKNPPEESPYAIELQETRVRFENDGTGRLEVHVRSRVQTQKGAQQLSQLAFRYTRSMEQLEINSVVVHKPGGGSMEILSSAVVDRPVEEVKEAPAYQDAREKAVRVPALKPGDVLEYRVTTTIIKPAASDQFWFAHDFSRELPSGEESLEIDVPREREIHLKVRDGLALLESKNELENRVVHRWKTSQERAPDAKEAAPKKTSESAATPPAHDIQLTTFSNWEEVARWLSSSQPASPADGSVVAKANELAAGKKEDLQKLEELYSFVAARVRTIPLPLGAVGWKPLPAEQVLKQGYGTATDKHALLAALAKHIGLPAEPVFLGGSADLQSEAPSPAQIAKILTAVPVGGELVWLDTSDEVAPFRMIASRFRNKSGLALLQPSEKTDGASSGFFHWLTTPMDPPFPATQTVTIASELGADGKLTSHVTYALRGDTELLMRVTFHNTPKEQWKTIGLLLAFADGLRGTISNVTPADPAATADPFQIDFHIVQDHAVKWSEQKASLPLPLPGIGLPDLPERSPEHPGGSPLDLGTPLDIHTRVTIALPRGVTARAPFPVSVKRDYAEYRSTYRLEGNRLIATRDLRFLLRELPAVRFPDYAAFFHAVRNDEAQITMLERTAPPAGKPPAKKTTSSVSR